MLTLDLNSLPQDFSKITLPKQEVPSFASYQTDIQALYLLAAKYGNIANFIVVGRGGSCTGFRGIYTALAKPYTTKKVHILDTIDPDYTTYLRSRCPPQDTLIIAISKSGNTVDVIENVMSFPEYRKIIVSEKGDGALRKVAENKGLELVDHPQNVGGRFSTGTECALLPAALIYVDIKSIVEGMNSMYAKCAPHVPITENPALQLAASLFLAEQQGMTEVYSPVYSKLLAGSTELWTQLMHETVCKNGKGQTFLFMEGPECQHHTNQKFFDGPRRVAGLFVRVDQPRRDVELAQDPHAHELIVGDLPFKDLEGSKLSEAMKHEWVGVKQAADDAGIMNGTVTLDVLNPGTFGEITAFWEYVATYSAWLRGLDAFNQPGVEASKRIAREARKK